MSKNDITGDTLISKPNNDKYGDGYDRIFGKKPKEELTIEHLISMSKTLAEQAVPKQRGK